MSIQNKIPWMENNISKFLQNVGGKDKLDLLLKADLLKINEVTTLTLTPAETRDIADVFY